MNSESRTASTAHTPSATEHKKLGSGHTSSRVFQVQARARLGYPSFALGPREIFDQEWRDVHLTAARLPVGVAMPRYHLEDVSYGVPFPQAEAHRLAFICLVETAHPGHTVDTRIVERYVERRWRATEIGVVTEWPHWVDGHNIWNQKTGAW